ncbi:HAD family phosphatase [uncultured Bifidobacterium sp.]|uniref:HAD family hydrolase n=1 Tax=uncultured Bifidobacterium sp. TaxID=165187 RepID=UPI00260EF11B|nr:HAD family phosphatase [uncultured Bifidobacterium sp.]
MNDNMGKAAIFDLDGTLLDSMGVWDEVDEDFLGRRGIRVPDDYMAKVSAMEAHDIAVYTIDRFQLDDTPEDLMSEWNLMAARAYASTVEAKPHAVEYVRHLHETGARLAIATTLPTVLRGPAMDHVGLTGLFDVVCGVEDVAHVGKDSPDIYLHTAERLGVEPGRCTVFEDLLEGVRSAKRAGMSVWAMHDDSSDRSWPTICDEADGVLFDFDQAPRIL